MNVLNISNGSYILSREDEKEFSGESVNLLLIVFEDTITIFDRVYKRVLPILNCLVSNVTLNGNSYGTASSFETAFKNAVETEGGGGETDPDVVFLSYIDGESSIKDSEGEVVSYSDITELLENDKLVLLYYYVNSTKSIGSLLYLGISGNSYVFSGCDSGFFGRLDKVSINNTNNVSRSTFTGVQNSSVVTSIDSSSTNSQIPSAKCVYDLIGDVETVLNAING